jgi:hypothetical protein
VTDFVLNERLVFENGESRLRIDVEDGRISLHHEGPGVSDDLPGFSSSWNVALAILAHALTVHPGRPRRTHWIARPGRTSASQAHLCFTEPAALSRWLGTDAEVGQEGEPWELVLANGENVEGEVLVNIDGRDVAYTLRDRGDSVLVLRTLPLATPGERLVALCWSLWSRKEPGEEDIVDEFERAMERLSRLLSQSGEA